QATVETQTGVAALTATAQAPVPVATVTATLAAPSLTPGQTTQATAVAKDESGNVLTGRTVAWASLSPSTATASSAGVVTAGAASGHATVAPKGGAARLAVTRGRRMGAWAARSREPAGMTIVRTYEGETLTTRGSSNAVGEVSVGTDPRPPGGWSYVLQLAM